MQRFIVQRSNGGHGVLAVGKGRQGKTMRDVGSVAVGLARWRAVFLAGFVTLFLLKLMLAATLSPFGDEAFYWQESRHLAWGYSDLPPLTAWLIRLGETVAGHSLLGMRWPFLVLGSTLPWLGARLGPRAVRREDRMAGGRVVPGPPAGGQPGRDGPA
ncbi:hypothetical protein [Dyella sp. EPa41]|uniref:hypothetical protein n=1 Tax=Dyella sp. EPa41 TaxID=1561194 RepID=UPI001F208188|nr:hypothetical protein [Dyella sp. EPa41]